MARKQKIIEQIRFTGIADKGRAIGRSPEGKVYFVEGAVPGDTANALIFKRKKKGVEFGVVREIIIPSPDRTDPFCKHFALCGGCKWQNLTYEGQLREKEKVVYDAFERLAKVEIKHRESILGAEPIKAYRNKMEYAISTRRWVPQEELDAGGEVSFGPSVGFHRSGSFDKVVEVDQCFLQDDYGNQIRNFVKDFALERDWSFYNIRDHVGFMRKLFLRNNRKGEWMVNVVFGENNEENIKEILGAIRDKFTQIASLFYTINEKWNDNVRDLEMTLFHGADHIVESIGHAKFKIGPKSFFQTNAYQAEQLYATVLEFANFDGTENVYDLYTGLGSIALYVADHCKQVVGIEEIPEAIEDALQNRTLNKNENTTFYAGDVKNVLTDAFAQKHGKPDLLITDPPRAGMHEEVVKMLLKLRAPKIIYVSCNPSTQARDVKLLSELYDVERVRPVDMFPHTDHIENVALLKLRNEKG